MPISRRQACHTIGHDGIAPDNIGGAILSCPADTMVGSVNAGDRSGPTIHAIGRAGISPEWARRDAFILISGVTQQMQGCRH